MDINAWGAALAASLTTALSLFLGAIPRIIGFLVILVIGWFISGLLASAVAALLRAVKFNELAQRSGFSGFVQNMGLRTDASGLLASIVKWFVRLIVLVVASMHSACQPFPKCFSNSCFGSRTWSWQSWSS